MNKEQITFLMNAGFSMDEIMQMQNPSHDPQPAPQPDPEPAPQPSDQDRQIQQLTQAVMDLTQLVQKNNINGMQFGSPQPDRTVDDILAEIINPPGKHLKGGNS